jgi:hypothetical protein
MLYVYVVRFDVTRNLKKIFFWDELKKTLEQLQQLCYSYYEGFLEFV